MDMTRDERAELSATFIYGKACELFAGCRRHADFSDG